MTRLDKIAEGPLPDQPEGEASDLVNQLIQSILLPDKPAVRQLTANFDYFLANERDKNGYTILMYATETNDPEIVQLVLQTGVDPEITDFNGNTARDYTNDPSIIQLIDQFTSQPTPPLQDEIESFACGNRVDPISGRQLRPAKTMSIYWHTSDYKDFFPDEQVEKGAEILSLDPRRHCYDITTLKNNLLGEVSQDTRVGEVVAFPPSFFVRAGDVQKLIQSTHRHYTAKIWRTNVEINNVYRSIFSLAEDIS